MYRFLFVLFAALISVGVWACAVSVGGGVSSPQASAGSALTSDLPPPGSEVDTSSQQSTPVTSQRQLPPECQGTYEAVPDTQMTVRCSCSDGKTLVRWVANKSHNSAAQNNLAYCLPGLLYDWQVLRTAIPAAPDASAPVPDASVTVPAPDASTVPPADAGKVQPPPVRNSTSYKIKYECDTAKKVAKRSISRGGSTPVEFQTCAGENFTCVAESDQDNPNVPPCVCINGKAITGGAGGLWTCQ